MLPLVPSLLNHDSLVPNDDALRGQVMQDGRTRTYFRVVPDGYVSNHRCVCSNDDSFLQFRMPITAYLSCPSESHSMEQRTVVIHHGRLSHNDACGVVDQDTPSELGAGVEVHTENLGYARLHHTR